MLAKSIALSRKVSRLSLKSALIYTWCIPFLDDFGLMTSEPEGIKVEVFGRRKEITAADIRKFIAESSERDEEGDSLTTEYKDCIKFNHFEDYQSITTERRAKSKFSKIPRIPQENIGENNIPQESPAEIRRVKVSSGEVKLNEVKAEIVAKAPSPSETARSFFSDPKSQEAESVVSVLAANGMPEKVARSELAKFIAYWTEPSRSGARVRWEGEKFFDLKRRLGTWFRNAKQWDADGKGNKKISWL